MSVTKEEYQSLQSMYGYMQRFKGRPQPPLPPKDLIKNHRSSLENLKKAFNSNTLNTTIFDTFCSHASLESLTPILASELRVEICHTGRYLLDALITIIQDTAGNLVTLHLYNYVDIFSRVDELFVGSIILIKEPYLTYPQTVPIVAVDSPTDVLLIFNNDANFNALGINKVVWKWKRDYKDPVDALPIPETPFDWKSRGNDLYKVGEFAASTRAYTHGIRDTLKIYVPSKNSPTKITVGNLKTKDVVEICVDIFTTVRCVKKIIAYKLGYEIEAQKLVYRGKGLRNGELLVNYDIIGGEKIFITLSQEYSNAAFQIEKHAVILFQLLLTLHLNRSACFLALERFDEALDDAEIVILADPRDEKAFARAGKACYALRKFEQARDYFYRLRQLTASVVVKADYNRAVLRMKEEGGEYDMLSLYRNWKSGKSRRMDNADFMGDIRIANIPSKGNGILATKVIATGKLIMVSKAFVAVYDDENANDVHINKTNYKTKKRLTQSEVQLIAMIARKLKNNPSTVNELIGLFAGPDYKCPNLVNARGEVGTDIDYINRIVSYNSFVGHSKPQIQMKDTKTSMGLSENLHTESVCGIWPKASYFNNDCVPNAVRYYMNDIMFVVATRTIKKNDEVTVSYVGGEVTYDERKSIMLAKYDFVCTCVLCRLQSTNSNFLNNCIGQFIFDLIPRMNLGDASILPTTRKLLGDMIVEYDRLGRTRYRLEMISPLFAIMSLHSRLGHFKKSIECRIQILDIYGFNIDKLDRFEMSANSYFDTPVGMVIIGGVADYFYCNDIENGKKWLGVARKMDRLFYGFTDEMFRIEYKQFAEFVGFTF